MVYFILTVTSSLIYVFFVGTLAEPGIGIEGALVWYQEKALMILWTPTLFALVLMVIFRGRTSLCKLLARVTDWNVGYKWWCVALILPAAVHVTAALITLGDDVEVIRILDDWWRTFLGSFFFLFLIVVGEELGWRGYALPALQAHVSPSFAAAIVGVFWSTWHIGIWYGLFLGISGSVLQALFFLIAGTVYILGLSAVLTWIANETRASVAIAMEHHAANNASIRI
jgi:membrane protease YdiL (CAAX protease family)|tara:strand:+ start:18503 stop:19183 length:681 start_codon:yes stop_codon:yes gene_type:complete